MTETESMDRLQLLVSELRAGVRRVRNQTERLHASLLVSAGGSERGWRRSY